MFNPNSILEITIATGYWTPQEDGSEIPETKNLLVPTWIELTALTETGEQHFVGFIPQGDLQNWEFQAIKDAISDSEHPTIDSVSGSINGGPSVELLIWEGMSKINPAAVIASTSDRIAIRGKLVTNTQED